MKNIIINNNSQDPIYQQIYDQIAVQIIQGKLESDTLLPSIRKMAKEIRVSIITIKKAWELLESNGLIYTVAGKGSYVKENSEDSLRDLKYLSIEEKINETLALAKSLDISKEELLELITTLYET